MYRRIAVAIPARNEAANLPSCLAALRKAADALAQDIYVLVLANNCDDDTAAVVAEADHGGRLQLSLVERQLSADMAHAGFARRLVLDAAADLLREPGDLLLSTDADTVVAEDWLTRTRAYFDQGFDAVAGLARLKPITAAACN